MVCSKTNYERHVITPLFSEMMIEMQISIDFLQED